MAESIRLQRTFSYNNLDLEDPDPDMTPDQVMEFYAGIYPELTQAVAQGPEIADEKLKYVFHKAVGTKGRR